MIDQLFGSKTRVKLLHLFYANPNRSFYVREITRKIDEQINSVRRELSNLLSVGIISSDSNNNRLYYEVNQDYEFYEAFRAIFSKAGNEMIKTDEQEQRFRDLGSIKAAYLLGNFVREEGHPVDVMIIGDVNQTKLQKLMKELEEEQMQELRYAVMSEKEYYYRDRIGDRFLAQVQESKKTAVIDDLHEAAAPKDETKAAEDDTEEATPKKKSSAKRTTTTKKKGTK